MERVKKIAILDVEYNHLNGFLLIGIYSKDYGYIYFMDVESAFSYLEKFFYIFAYNLDYDFSFFLHYVYEKYKVYTHFNQSGIIYVDIYFKKRRQIWKDLSFHCGRKKVEELALYLGMKKQDMDYDKMSKKNIRKVIKYNENDLLIEYKIHSELLSIYKSLGCKKVNATIGSNAMEVYRKRFAYKVNFDIREDMIKEWEECYKGGLCQAFIKGEHRGKFYLIDVNSMYLFIMQESYPIPDEFQKVKKLKGNEKFYLIKTEAGLYTNFDIEYLFDRTEDMYYYVFNSMCYPFKKYVNKMMELKIKSEKEGKQFDRMVYKLLGVSLYGKFAQRGQKEILVSENSIENYLSDPDKNVEELTKGIYRVWWESKYPYWSNFIWSIFTTARARKMMYDSIEDVISKGFKVYHCDTDSLLISGDITKLKEWIDPYQIGKWKIEKEANYINVIGKKLYIMDDLIKCKGVGGFKKIENQRIFINNRSVTYKKFVRIKESLRRGFDAGSIIDVKKENKVN